MKIAINGTLGSGKSTIAKLMAEKLGYKRVSTGDWFRELAAQKHLSVVQLNELAEQDKQIDDYIDSRLKALNDVGDDMIIDSRMAPYFIKNAIKIRLIVSDEEGARRIFCDPARGVVERFDTLEEAKEGFRRRSQSERERYAQIYGINIDDEKAYDLIIDTSNLEKEEVLKKILSFIEQKQ